MKTNDGGPAFPCDRSRVESLSIVREQFPGMSLRDWFAGMALQGLVANGSESRTLVVVGEAYAFADAMLAERNK